MDKTQMMICPKAEGCKKTCEEPDHKHPHIQNKECQYGSCVHRIACGVCIPYEPSPKDKCLRCGKDTNGYKVCNECWQAQHRKPSPEPSMPLIEGLLGEEELAGIWKDYAKRWGSRITDSQMFVFAYKDALNKTIQEWLPAHDQQVLKDFAEKCIKGLPALSKGDEECCESCAFFIMEMAEKE